MSILAALTPNALTPFFNAGALSRGFAYAREGRIVDPELDKLTDDTVIASAEALGSGRSRYVVRLYAELSDGDFWATSTCTCPVQVDCKHGVALAATIATPIPLPRIQPEPWRDRLDQLEADLRAAAQHETWHADPTPLALELGLAQRRYPHHGPRSVLTLRPMRLGAKGRWVKTGADWTNLTSTLAQRSFRRAEVDAVLDLAAALHASGSTWRHTGAVDVSLLGRRLIDLLKRARDAGVPLLAAPGLRSVTLRESAVEVVCDTVRRGDEVVLTVHVDDAEGAGSGEVIPIGSPAHALGLIDDEHLTLAAAVSPVPDALLALLVGGDEITVPGHGEDRVRSLLTRVGRAVRLVSSDDSITLPEPIRPQLEVEVSWLSSTEASLRWRWRYADQVCDLDAPDLLGGLRDRTAERAIRDRVPHALLGLPRATDGDALALAIHDLPALQEIEGVEVVERHRPRFRETDEAPAISFEVAEEQPEATDWLDLDVTIAVEGEHIPLPSVLAVLTRGEDHLILPSGLYVRTDRPEFERLREVVGAAAALREAGSDRLSVGKHDLGVWGQLAELGVVDDQAAEWVRRARALSELTELPRPEPTGLATELRGYQREGFWWLAFLWQHRLGGILADDMGLGKTLQVLALIQHAVATDAEGPFLVVAPTSVVSAWQSESARHAPGLRVAAVTRRSDEVAATAADADVVVTTYSLLRLEQDAFAAVRWAGMILDEAHQVKNHKTKTYAATRLIDAPFRLAVTGTPFENRLMELWALLSITVPGIYPWPRAFTSQVANPVEKQGDQLALARFRRRIRPFLLRRTKELVAADLPVKQEQVLDIELGPRHRRIYEAHLAKERQRILGLLEDFEQNRVAIFSALTTLRRAALDPALLDAAHDRVGSAKLDVLVEDLAAIIAAGHRALVFSQFTSYLARVRTGLAEAGIETAYLDGSTRDRAGAIAHFRAGEAPVFLISLKAGGVGLTLTEADYVFVLDPWWNPATEAQAVDRAHRIGQTRPVHVYRMIATGTIEEKVAALKERKAELFARVVDGEAASAQALTAEDVRSLFE